MSVDLDERLLRLDQADWYDECRRDLTSFACEALSPLNQAPAAHHRVMLEHLERVARGEIQRLMVLMPPGHAKSTYCSVIFPAWLFGRIPRLDMIGVSHASTLAEKFSGRVQDMIQNNRSVLGYGLASESVEEWETTNGGTYRAAGVGGSITGRRADLAIIDDPVKDAADAESLTVQEAQWEWYTSTLYTRLKPGGRIILVMTRWSPNDLGGRILSAAESGGDRWTVLKMPAICDSADDPLGRRIGAALWPAWQDETALLGGTRPERIEYAEYDHAGVEVRPERRIPAEQVAGIRANVGEYVWGALYQQDPRPRGAVFFDLDHLLVDVQSPSGISTKGPAPMPTRCDAVFCVIDTAIKTGKQHNSTAVIWYSTDSLTRPPVLILDWDIVQIEGAGQADWLERVHREGEALAKECRARRGYIGALIEDKATGTVLLQQSANLRRQGKYAPAHALDSVLTAMGKDERAIAAQPYIIAGDLKLTERAFNKTTVLKGRSANHLITQVTGFRLASKETDGLDLLDCFTYGATTSRGAGGGDRKGV